MVKCFWGWSGKKIRGMITSKMQDDVAAIYWRSAPLVFTSVCVTALELSNNSLMSLCSLQAGPHSWHHEDGHHIGCAVTKGGQGSQQHAPEGQWRAISRTLAMITPRSCHCANRHKPIADIIMRITWTSSETVSTECTLGNFEEPGKLEPSHLAFRGPKLPQKDFF